MSTPKEINQKKKGPKTMTRRRTILKKANSNEEREATQICVFSVENSQRTDKTNEITVISLDEDSDPPPTLFKQFPGKEDRAQRLFGLFCVPHLNGHCPSGSVCLSSHNHPLPESIQAALIGWTTADILHVYDTFVLKNIGAFIRYFLVFAQVFADRRQRLKLMFMIEDLLSNSDTRLDPYVGSLYYILLASGLNQRMIFEELLSSFRRHRMNTMRCNIIVDMVVDSSILFYFVDDLKWIVSNRSYVIPSHVSLKLIEKMLSRDKKIARDVGEIIKLSWYNRMNIDLA